MNKELVLISFHNAKPFIYEFVSDKPITLDRVMKCFKDDGFIDDKSFDKNRDSISFVKVLTSVTI